MVKDKHRHRRYFWNIIHMKLRNHDPLVATTILSGRIPTDGQRDIYFVHFVENGPRDPRTFTIRSNHLGACSVSRFLL